MGQGLEDLKAVLKGLPLELQSTILADGVALGAKPVVTAAKALAPVDSGALRASITSVVRKDKRSGIAFALVGPASQYYNGKKKVKAGESRKGASNPARYAHNVEFGHSTPNGKEIAAKPFMRPAARVAEHVVPGQIAAGIQKGLIKAARRLTKTGNA